MPRRRWMQADCSCVVDLSSLGDVKSNVTIASGVEKRSGTILWNVFGTLFLRSRPRERTVHQKTHPERSLDRFFPTARARSPLRKKSVPKTFQGSFRIADTKIGHRNHCDISCPVNQMSILDRVPARSRRDFAGYATWKCGGSMGHEISPVKDAQYRLFWPKRAFFRFFT